VQHDQKVLRTPNLHKNYWKLKKLELLQETKEQKLDKATGNLKPKTQLQHLQQDSSLGASSKTSSCQKKKKKKKIYYKTPKKKKKEIF